MEIRRTLCTLVGAAATVASPRAEVAWDIENSIGLVACVERAVVDGEECVDRRIVDVVAAEGAITRLNADCVTEETDGLVDLTMSVSGGGHFVFRALSTSFNAPTSSAATNVELEIPFRVPREDTYQLRAVAGHRNGGQFQIVLKDAGRVVRSWRVTASGDDEYSTMHLELPPGTLEPEHRYAVSVLLIAESNPGETSIATLEHIDVVPVSTPTAPVEWAALKSTF